MLLKDDVAAVTDCLSGRSPSLVTVTIRIPGNCLTIDAPLPERDGVALAPKRLLTGS